MCGAEHGGGVGCECTGGSRKTAARVFPPSLGQWQACTMCTGPPTTRPSGTPQHAAANDQRTALSTHLGDGLRRILRYEANGRVVGRVDVANEHVDLVR